LGLCRCLLQNFVGTRWAGTSLSKLYRLDIFKFAQYEGFISVLGTTIPSIENRYDSLCGCRTPRASAGKGSTPHPNYHSAKMASTTTTTSASASEYTTPLVPVSTATLTIAARHTCNAPAALVFRTLRNTETWRDWNRFCPHVTIGSQPDDDDEREAMEFWAARPGYFGGPGEVSDAVKQVHTEGTERRKSLHVESAAAAAAAAGGGGGGGGRAGSPAGATRKSTDSARKGSGHVTRKLRHMGGEPNVRLKDGTRMTFHVRMKMPYKMADYTDSALMVTEVSRPNDPVNDDYSLTTTPTHTDTGKSGIYRISWATDPDKGLGRGGYPKFMLQAQRVHEIRPLVDGTGQENSCEIVTWECQRGLLAKVVKSLYGKYLQDRFEEWVKGLGDFCEALVGKVDRRDFGAPAAPRRS
jgi:hypothetical protein